jgi:RNA polymerase sigma-70 factor, ECF subfamily
MPNDSSTHNTIGMNQEQRELAFRLFVNSSQQPLYQHIRRLVITHEDAADILQETYIKAWKAYLEFRGESTLSTWIYKIATNEALTFLRRQKIRQLIVPDKGLQSIPSMPDYQGDELQKLLLAATTKLAAKQRIVFNLRYYEEMKYAEISAITGTSEGALKALYHTARKKVEKLLISNLNHFLPETSNY